VDTCAICRSELAAEWNFCVHCGAPVPARADEPDPIPSAIRPERVLLPRPSRRADARLVFGLAMAAVGLVVVIYALISLLGARG
jgi:hypothetical protein